MVLAGRAGFVESLRFIASFSDLIQKRPGLNNV